MATYTDHHWVIPDVVKIYRRVGTPMFQVRMKHPEENGYIVRSTKKKTQAEAMQAAITMYGQLSYKIENQIEIRDYSFKDLFKLWWDVEKDSKSKARAKYILGTTNRYFIPFFLEHLQNKKLTALTDKDFDDYWIWRKAYWKTGAGIQAGETAKKRLNNHGKMRHSKLGNVAKEPSYKTLTMEKSVLKSIFWFGNRRGILDRNPYIKVPKPAGQKNKERARRPAFSEDEWKVLYTYLRRYVREGVQNRIDDVPARAHKLHIQQREMFRHYILFMGQSGLRPNEARQMRWRDIKTNPKNGLKYIQVRPTTKTGERDSYPVQSAFRTLERLKTLTSYNEPDDFVFTNQEGEPHTNFGKTLQKVLNDLGILKDEWGRARTVYSLRHMYATFRLELGDVGWQALADNMGTSPKMLFEHYRHVTTHQKSEELVHFAPRENKTEQNAL